MKTLKLISKVVAVGVLALSPACMFFSIAMTISIPFALCCAPGQFLLVLPLIDQLTK